eukprot:3706271-Pleurochrysis_carterae.AAC.1
MSTIAAAASAVLTKEAGSQAAAAALRDTRIAGEGVGRRHGDDLGFSVDVVNGRLHCPSGKRVLLLAAVQCTRGEAREWALVRRRARSLTGRWPNMAQCSGRS